MDCDWFLIISRRCDYYFRKVGDNSWISVCALFVHHLVIDKSINDGGYGVDLVVAVVDIADE